MKTILALSFCFFASTVAFAQDEPAPAQTPTEAAPPSSVIDQELTVVEPLSDSMPTVATDGAVTAGDAMIPSDAVIPGQGMDINQANVIGVNNVPQGTCGCQQTAYNAQPYAAPMTNQPMYGNQVYSGSSFNTGTMQGYPVAPSYQRTYTAAPVYNYQYYAPARMYAPLRRGVIFPRFRR